MYKLSFLDTLFKKHKVSKSEHEIIKILICINIPFLLFFVLYNTGYLIGILIAYFQKVISF